MKPTRSFSLITLVSAVVLFAAPAFAEKIGVKFDGNAAMQSAVSEALKADGHEIVDIAAAANVAKLDPAAAVAIGQKTGAQIIVHGKKVGNVIILKILSTKNDTVAGGTCPAGDNAAASAQVKKILAENKSKLLQ